MPSRVLLVLLALLGLLLAAPGLASAATTAQILDDCEDDSRLSKTYTPRELRDARDDIPSDSAIYSDCADVLRAALAASARNRAGQSGAGGGSGDGSGTASPDAGSGSVGGGGGGGGGATGSSQGLDPLGPGVGSQGVPVASQDDLKELRSIRENLPEVDVRGQRVVPGVRGVAGQAATATVPPTLVLALGLLGLTAVLALVPLVRRRVLARRAE